MPLSLFKYDPNSYLKDAIGNRGGYEHTFGGSFKSFGIKVLKAPRPMHLVYRLDLSDPLIGLKLPEASFLPLLNPINCGPDCVYQVLSNTQIKLLSPTRDNYLSKLWDAPEAFPLSPTSFSTQLYDSSKAKDAVKLKGLFGWDSLSSAEKKKAIKLAGKLSSYTLKDAPDDDWSLEDVFRCMFHPPFPQGEPSTKCKNPNCTGGRCSVIAIQDRPLEPEMIWPDPFVQTIWTMCDRCQCISVSNQCGQSPIPL